MKRHFGNLKILMRAVYVFLNMEGRSFDLNHTVVKSNQILERKLILYLVKKGKICNRNSIFLGFQFIFVPAKLHILLSAFSIVTAFCLV
jgi:hypothetical protein